MRLLFGTHNLYKRSSENSVDENLKKFIVFFMIMLYNNVFLEIIDAHSILRVRIQLFEPLELCNIQGPLSHFVYSGNFAIDFVKMIK